MDANPQLVGQHLDTRLINRMCEIGRNQVSLHAFSRQSGPTGLRLIVEASGKRGCSEDCYPAWVEFRMIGACRICRRARAASTQGKPTLIQIL